MYKLLVLYREPTDRNSFKTYYEKVHLPLTAKMPGLVNWSYSLNLHTTVGEAVYFGVFTAEFENEASFKLAMSSPEGQAVQDDLANYATGGAEVLHFETNS